MIFRVRLPHATLLLALVASTLRGQDRGAVGLDQLVRGITVTPRVLMIGAHPDDEDTNLITWLARGRQVETAYLSLTRGDGGQNLIGNELGEALGAIRTQELLAARRLDGGRQYFSRAYDFGFSKSAEETFKHWDRETLLSDIVTVIRAFRPTVIVSVWTGTPADGHGHHVVSGILARDAYDVAGDTVRFPASKNGQPWEPLKFYTGARFNGAQGTLGINVGEYDPVLGRAYGEVAAESRAQHRSQGQGRAQLQRGMLIDSVTRRASRVNESTSPASERSLFDGIDTSFVRLVRAAQQAQQPALNSIQALADSARAALDLRRPDGVERWLARAAELAQMIRAGTPRCTPPRGGALRIQRAGDGERGSAPGCDADARDLDASLDVLRTRTATAALTAAGVVVEATAERELLAFGDSMPVTVTVYNRGRQPVTLDDVRLTGTLHRPMSPVAIAPDSAVRFVQNVIGLIDTRPWWLGNRMGGDMFPVHESPADGISRISYGADADMRPGPAVPEDSRRETDVEATMRLTGSTVSASAGPIVYRASDPVLGEQNRPVGGVPAVSLSFGHGLEWVVSGKPIDRLVRLTLKSYATSPRTMSFQVLSPPGIKVDSVPASLTLEAGEEKELFLRLRGQLKAGVDAATSRYEFGVAAVTPNGKYLEGLTSIEYGHIHPIRLYRYSAIYLQAVDITVPAALAVAYVQGVGDDVAANLRQLGIPVTVVQAAELPLLDLTRFSTVVVGPRAYAASRELIAYNARLIDFARKGGTVVVQYGQQEMARPGVLPYPITHRTPTPQRVTEEQAPVTILDPRSKLLNSPNKIAESDWAEWVQERTLYMPNTFDPRWSAPLEMHDPGEPDNKGALLVAPVGKGTYVYTTLALFRQLPAGVPGGPRLLVNLLSAGIEPPKRVQP